MRPEDSTYLTLRIFFFFFVVYRLRSRLSEESLVRCHRIYELPEIERTWAQLHTDGMLSKVDLLPSVIVETIDTPLDLGEHFV